MTSINPNSTAPVCPRTAELGELADVGGMDLTAPNPAVDGLTRFVDVWFDNDFTDLAVRGPDQCFGHTSRP